MTEKQFKYFDEKFDSINIKITKIDQALTGYNGAGGALKEIKNNTKKNIEIERRLKIIEENKKARLSIFLSLIGSGGLITTIILKILGIF